MPTGTTGELPGVHLAQFRSVAIFE
jgi:hypothetical protein